ncbi:MAG: ABC transporter permease [Legionella sp.]|uniref:ABC transporter permease n=1 Tax=Legionella sp. TaxID=459 RepID=UPI00283D4F42|nr:ABC transporter permease [Legionella sp.]
MTFDFLWTDKCFLILLVLGTLTILLSLRKQHIRRSFSMILHRPIAVSAGIILLAFITIGVLDSIHFQSNNQSESSISVLDKLLSPIDEINEKTYSAPLALYQFVTDTMLVNGVVTQFFPRLNYPAKWVSTEAEKEQVLKSKAWYSLQWGLGVGLVFVGMLILYRYLCGSKPNRYFTSTNLTVVFTLTLLTFFIVYGYQLSRVFHVLGTGQIGQDIFYFTIKSIRTGLIIGLLTTLFMLPLALFLGVVAGYFGGLADDIIQYVYTTLSSIPGVLLITASILSLQTYIANHPEQFPTLAQSADARLLALCLILGVTSWTSLCRLLRAEALKLREVDYVLAARALGSNWFTILRKHLLPNVMHIVVITLVLDFSFLVMAEALLSYVGVGVSPMTISWGNMINSARLELARDPVVWWPMLAAFIFMFLLVLAINLFADAVRDAFDPRQ